jgi:Flp pilus assembly protein TadB
MNIQQIANESPVIFTIITSLLVVLLALMLVDSFQMIRAGKEKRRQKRLEQEREDREMEAIHRILPEAWKAGMEELCRRHFERGRQAERESQTPRQSNPNL